MNTISVDLSATHRRLLRSQAHALRPTVAISRHGLTPTVLQEIERSLDAHELIKIRILDGDREARAQLLVDLCSALAATPVQHIGKVLVVWRKSPSPANDPHATPPPQKRPKRHPPRLTKKAAANAIIKTGGADKGKGKNRARTDAKPAVPRRRLRTAAA